MFKWPGTPSPQASAHEIADYAELVCWQRSGTSWNALSTALRRLDENDYSGGVPEEDKSPRVVEAVYTEIERRKEACRDGYPFVIGNAGYTLRVSEESANHKHDIYRYLLLATRLNMKDNRHHADMDGTLLFEELSSEAVRGYFGKRAETYLFGATAGNPDFRRRVDDLCKHMGEGQGFHSRSGAASHAGDGKLDVVVWKAFTDGLAGKLIAFGQCKTGTDYRDTLAQLQPDAFCDKWLRESPAVRPLRMFLVSEALPRSGWYDVARDAGLLFDRCRIVDYCDDVSSEVIKKVNTWTAAAKAASLSG